MSRVPVDVVRAQSDGVATDSHPQSRPMPVTMRSDAMSPPRSESSESPTAAGEAGGECSVGPGDVLGGKYRLVEVLNEGGMGTLFIAENLDLAVPVAVKLIRAGHNGETGSYLAERLLQEARAAASLGHPAIIKVYDVGHTEGGDPYVVMELLQGEDLRAAMDRHGQVEPTKVVRCLLPIAHALSVAHQNNVVHRDIKPGNIFLADTATGQYQPKLIDFGLAKMTRPQDHKLTWAGATIGTPDYMAPEQALGKEVDAAADIWSLCVVLYEAVAGTTPFHGKNHIALLHSIIEDAPLPLSAHGIDIERLWKILAKGLAKDPKERWSSMRELGAALSRWLISVGCSDDVCGAPIAKMWLTRDRNAPRDIFRTGRFRSADVAAGSADEAGPFGPPPDAPPVPSTTRRNGSMTPVVMAIEDDDSVSGIRYDKLGIPHGADEPADSSLLGELPTMPAQSIAELDPDGSMVEEARRRTKEAPRARAQSDSGTYSPPTTGESGAQWPPANGRLGQSTGATGRPAWRSVGIAAAGLTMVLIGMIGTWELLAGSPTESAQGATVGSGAVASAPVGDSPTASVTAPPVTSAAPSATALASTPAASATASATAQSTPPGSTSRATAGRVPRDPSGSQPGSNPRSAPSGSSAYPTMSDYLPPGL